MYKAISFAAADLQNFLNKILNIFKIKLEHDLRENNLGVFFLYLNFKKFRKKSNNLWKYFFMRFVQEFCLPVCHQYEFYSKGALDKYLASLFFYLILQPTLNRPIPNFSADGANAFLHFMYRVVFCEQHHSQSPTLLWT